MRVILGNKNTNESFNHVDIIFISVLVREEKVMNLNTKANKPMEVAWVGPHKVRHNNSG